MAAMTVTEATIIEESPERVFAYISNPENDVQWCPAVQEVTRVSGTPGQVGSTYAMRHAPGGMRFKATIELVEVSPPHRVRCVMTDGHSRIQGTYELVAEGEGRRLPRPGRSTSATCGTRVGGDGLGRGYIRKDLQKNLREQFARLKRLMDREVLADAARIPEQSMPLHNGSH